MNKTISILIILTFITNLTFLTSSNCEAGKILYIGGTGTGNFSSIQNAVYNSSDGDTIIVFPGFYNESVIVNREIDLIGKNKNNTIIDANNSIYYALLIQTQNISISGFTIQNSTAGIYVIGYENLSENNIISNNIFKNNDCGIHLSNSSKGTIINRNLISNNQGEGIRLYGSYNNIITENIITENGGFGIALWELSCNNSITNNSITNNFEGISLRRWCDNNIIFENDILKNRMIGISLTMSFNNNLSNNYVVNSSFGFYLDDSSKNIIFNNNFSGNHRGIYLYDSPNNTIDENNAFYENDQDIWDGSRSIKTPGFEFSAVIILFLLVLLFKQKRNVYKQ